MYQHKYQPISTIKISAKGEFHWVKAPSLVDPDRSCILQSYSTSLVPEIIESVQEQIDKILTASHPHLQSVVDVFATENGLHIVQELDRWDCAVNTVPYPPARAKVLLQEIIPVLAYLHRHGINHGNISPETIAIDEHHEHILTNFLTIVDLISKVGGETYPSLRSQLEEIPVINLPNGYEWDFYSLGVTIIALLTNLDYQYLYDPQSKKWNWEKYVDCSDELIREINRLLGQEKLPHQIQKEHLPAPIIPINLATNNHQLPARDRSLNSIITINFYRQIIGMLMISILGLLGYLTWGKLSNKLVKSDSSATFPQSFSQHKTLTVGYINRTPARDPSPAQKRDYPKFRSYLETVLRKKYGNNVQIELESVLTSRAAQTKINQKKWDIVFTFSATNSLVAEDNQYEFIARMSANEDPYRDVCFFVMNDSPIRNTKDFTSKLTIALPNDDSPIFIVPLYDLYGQSMRVNLGNTLSTIQEKVKSGKADVGVGFCKTISQNSQFRSLSPNRIIPVGGVFLSPKIGKSIDRDYIKESIIKAPDDIQLQANYTKSSGINYDRFRRISDRANQLLNCVDFTRNPVYFYCNKNIQ